MNIYLYFYDMFIHLAYFKASAVPKEHSINNNFSISIFIPLLSFYFFILVADDFRDARAEGLLILTSRKLEIDHLIWFYSKRNASPSTAHILGNAVGKALVDSSDHTVFSGTF